MSFKTRKTNIGLKSISELNWPSIIKVDQMSKEHAEKLLERFKHSNVIPQVLALLASAQFKLCAAEGKFSFGLSLKAWAEHLDSGKFFYFDDGVQLTKEDLQGMFSLLRCMPRSISLPDNATQLSAEWIRYATPVPLYLSAFKQLRNIKYSQWDLTDPKLAICTDLRNFQVFEYIGKETKWTNGELVAIRDYARTFKSGVKKGQMRTLNQTYTIPACEDPDFNTLPENVKLMLCQVWVYQPGCANTYGIYNLSDPDSPAMPLVDTEVFQSSYRDRSAQDTITSDTSHLDW